MLERITKCVRLDVKLVVIRNTDRYSFSFMAHPETLLPMPEIDDPVERFVSVVKFYLSGWHIKPPYVEPLVPLKLNHTDTMQRRQKTPQPHSW